MTFLGVDRDSIRATFEETLRRLGGVRRRGDRAMAKCPCHDDRSPSLSIELIDDERIVWHCFAGCSQLDVGHTLGLLGVEGAMPKNITTVRAERRPPADIEARHDAYVIEGRHREPIVRRWCHRMGLQHAAALRLGIGLDGNTVTLRMLDHKLRIVGIRKRDLFSGRKFAETGSLNGLFVPEMFDVTDTVHVVEGESDTIAADGLGLNVIGRAGCTSSSDYLVRLLRGRDVVVWADRDGPGRAGAESLVERLVLASRGVRMVEPPAPHNDVRAFVMAGATVKGLEDIADAAELRRPRVRFTGEGA